MAGAIGEARVLIDGAGALLALYAVWLYAAWLYAVSLCLPALSYLLYGLAGAPCCALSWYDPWA